MISRIESGGRPRRIAIDCDPGVDDALALALALVCPKVEIQAVTTGHGNVPARWACRNARRWLELCRAHLPEGWPLPTVYRGAAGPLRPRRVDRSISLAIHGEDGLGGLASGGRPALPRSAPVGPPPAHLRLLELARTWGRSLTVVALGPLTNLALAVRRDPAALRRVGRIVVMGGAARMPGNATAAAEFNIHCDPEAAAAVFACGAPVTLVGLDVTRRVVLSSRALGGGGSFRRLVRRLTRPYIDYSKRNRGTDGCVLHDPLALGEAVRPGFLRCARRRVEVECGNGPARGMTVVDLRPGREALGGAGVEVALEVDAPRFLRFFLSRLRTYRGG
ncbi:MAG: nucleoside hydrolase [Nitrospinota bacterium]